VQKGADFLMAGSRSQFYEDGFQVLVGHADASVRRSRKGDCAGLVRRSMGSASAKLVNLWLPAAPPGVSRDSRSGARARRCQSRIACILEKISKIYLKDFMFTVKYTAAVG
jgi:hypothetical protein